MKVTKICSRINLSYLRESVRSIIYDKPKIFQTDNISKNVKINRQRKEEHTRIFNVENPQCEGQKTMEPSLEKFHHEKYQ